MSEHQSATFECEVSFDDAVVTWYKGPTELTESPKYSFRSEGRCHYMTIHNVTAEDEGKNAWNICVAAILLSDFVVWVFFNHKGIQISTFLAIAGVYSVIARLEPRGEARSTAELYLVTKG